MECCDCLYFNATDNPEWKGRPHCCFLEWGHSDDEIAPCDDPAYEERVPVDYYDGE